METEKVCRTCQRSLPLTEYWTADKKRGYLRSTCKECDRATGRAYYAKTPAHRERVKAATRRWAKENPRTTELQRKYSLKHKFGLTEEQYSQMLTAQGGHCALCDRADGGRVGTKGKWKSNHFNVDHCHETGRVRGLLCHKCNVRIGAYEGLLKEVGMHRVIAYLSQT